MTNKNEEHENMALSGNRIECNKAEWDNVSIPYMNNEKTGKASREAD